MPDVTLTPVAGDPFNGGAQELDPSTAPPLTISLARQQNAADMANAMGSAPMDPGSVALAQRVQAGVGQVARGTAQGVADAVTLPRDVMQGQVDPQSDQGIARTLGMAGLMAAPGMGMAEEGAAGAMGGKLTVYHGSPHRFDAFDMSKIGTGEGAQAYGHGMYFTDTEPVAQGYRDALSGWNVRGQAPDMTNPNHVAAVALKQANGNPVEAVNAIGELRASAPTDAHYDAANQAIGMLSGNQKPNVRPKSAGHMYEVGINADPEHFLDWDKPLSQQSQHVQNALKYEDGTSPFRPDQTGSSIANNLGLMHWRAQPNRPVTEIQQIAAEELGKAGIPGIRYLDGMSRGAGQGTSNYVLFNPAQDATINRIYARGEAAAPLTMAEGLSKPTSYDPFAAMMAALDAHAPQAAADTGRLDPTAASWPLYHGTGDAWDTFDPSKAGARTSGAEKGAMFMSPREGEAASYAHGDGARVLPLTVTPGNTGVYDIGQLLATRDPRFMAASRAEHTGSQAAYDAALQRYDADVAYHQDLRSRMPADLAAEMPDYPAASNLLSPQSAAISMARADGRDTAILRGLGESSGGDQVVALRPGFVHDAVTGRQIYSGGLPIPGAASTVPAALQPNTPTPEMFGRMLREGRAT